MPIRYANLYGPNGQRQVVAVRSSQASALQSQGWGLKPGSYKAPASVDHYAQEQRSLGGLIEATTPKPVTDEELSGRFAALFDPTYNQNATDIGSELDLRSSRFGEDAATAAARRSAARLRQQSMTREAQAAGGASGQLADQQLASTLQPYDEASQDAGTQSVRFAYDTAEERRKRLLANQQARSTARAGYLADPNLRYEFSF